MTDIPGTDLDADYDPKGDGEAVEQPVALSGELVVRRRPASVATGRQRFTELRARVGKRLPEVARHPAVVATASAIATVGVGLAVGGVRQGMARAVSSGATSRPLVLTGYVVHHVHVMHHHVVHHTQLPPLPPR